MDRPRFQFRLWMIFVLTALVGWGMVTVPYWFYEIPLQHSAQKSGQYRLYPPQPPRLSVLEVLRTQFGRLPEVSFALVIILVSFLGGMRAERWRTNRRTRLSVPRRQAPRSGEP
jgi:hypothetical protein